MDSAQRQRWAILGALIAAWTGLPVALWLAAIGVVVGAIAGVFGISQLGGFLGTLLNNLGGGVLGALLGIPLGVLAGLLLVYYFLVTHPVQLFGALFSGAVVAVVVMVVMVRAEPWLMRLRGYRVPSRRERAKLEPLLLDVGKRMELSVVPALWISDAAKPGAWAHMRAIVVTRGLLGDYDASENPPKPDLDDFSLSAILAHELHHWNSGDVVANAMVHAVFFPVALIVNAVGWVRQRAEWVGVLLWAALWPAWLTTRLVVIPLMARRSRQAEYEADAVAAGLGDEYRLGLRRALDDLSAWERPRTGWEDVLAATHPPIEHRLERLEAPQKPEIPAVARKRSTRASNPKTVSPQRAAASHKADRVPGKKGSER